jgi:DNA-directed RNA polymerase sigma subunit (sigma70/sigma32)
VAADQTAVAGRKAGLRWAAQGHQQFQPEVGGSLSAYAAPCVSGEIKRHFRDKRWQIHVRRLLQDLLLEIRAVSGKLAQERGRAPADHELAALLGVTEDGIREARQAAWTFSAASLDAPLSDQEDAAQLADVLGRTTGRSTWRASAPISVACHATSWPANPAGTRRAGSDAPEPGNLAAEPQMTL